MNNFVRIFLGAALLLGAPRAALAQVIAVGAGPGAQQSVATPPEPPAWAHYYHAKTGSYVKPVLGIAAGFNYEHRTNIKSTTGEPLNLASLKNATAVILFGVEGRVADWATFHSEFRRDTGHWGTSVWQGTISLTAMDNFVRLEHWGASLAGGIVSDPASFDFLSMHALDMFTTDDFTLIPALYAGANRGQGLIARYTWKGLSAGLFYSGGGPLSTSLSYGFGGNVGPNGSLWNTPKSGIVDGEPKGGIQMDVLAPSLMFEHKYVDVRANAQFYWVNTDTETGLNAPLKGKLFRAGARGKIWKDRIQPFANIAYRTNDMVLQSPLLDPMKLNRQGYTATVVSGGLDLNIWGLSGIGVNYAYVHRQVADAAATNDHFLNVGGTYWVTPNVSVGARYAKLITTTERMPDSSPDGLGWGRTDGRMDRDALFLSLRLIL